MALQVRPCEFPGPTHDVRKGDGKRFAKVNQIKISVQWLFVIQAREEAVPVKDRVMAENKLQLIHADLCGPISPPTPSGNKYVFLLVDDFSRTIWAFLLKTKYQSLEAFKNFKALVEKEASDTIKILRMDRGVEFTSNEFEDYCAKAGIKRQFTAPYTPQQNGVVERRNRTV